MRSDALDGVARPLSRRGLRRRVHETTLHPRRRLVRVSAAKDASLEGLGVHERLTRPAVPHDGLGVLRDVLDGPARSGETRKPGEAADALQLAEVLQPSRHAREVHRSALVAVPKHVPHQAGPLVVEVVSLQTATRCGVHGLG
uniref:Uncharacterized protein n=1 Tax=uncultured marine virus TaxID=186617 RepID=A0A0F7L7X1_9VIRU|nr:hypothetical protein [uncultured marine virus]